MKLIKYDKSNSSSVSNSSSSSSNTYIGSNNLARSIWGQYDDGDDVDGSMIINGNVIIREVESSYGDNYEEDSEEDDNDEEDDLEEGGGNLSVEFKITSNEVESNDIYAKQHLYIPHPDTKVKTDIVDLLKGYDNRITTNTNSISGLSTTVNNHTTNIANNSINIQNNADEIEKLKKSAITEDRIKELISQNTSSGNGSFNNPIILFSGRAYRFTSQSYSIYGCQIQKFSLSVEINKGLMTINITPNNGVKVHVYSINVLQWGSDKTNDISDVDLKERNAGAHWFEAHPDNVYDTRKIYIREFHQTDSNNDSWDSTTWFDYDSVNAVNITLVGYITEE